MFVLARDVGDLLERRRRSPADAAASSTVTETLTSEVVTTSTDVPWLLERPRRCAAETRAPSSMRVDVMSTTVTPFFDATAVSGRSVGGRSRVMSVPRAILRPRAS